MRRRTMRGTVIVAVAVMPLVLGACSFFGGQGAGPEPRKDEVRLGDFYFQPNDLTARRGEQVTLRLRNVGTTIHNFRIDEFGVDQDVEAGRDETVTFTPDQTGTFRIICDIPGHVEAGMVAELTVNP